MQSHHRQRQSNIPRGQLMALLAAAFVGAVAAGCGGGGSGSGSDASTTGSGGSSGTGGHVVTGGGGSTGSGGTPAATSPLGQPCAAAADCKTGLTCVPPSDKTIYGKGGPSHGYCTMPCMDSATAATCTMAGGICVDVGDGMTPLVYCMQTCASGGTTMKCNDRSDVACIPLTDANGNAATPACLPVCSQDSDCPTGRKCDDGLNICVDMIDATKKTFGSKCAYDPTMKMEECAGFCVPVAGTAAAPTATFCSKGCVFGFASECGWVDKGVSLKDGLPHGFCISLANAPAKGDPGFCLQLCDTTADCTNQGDPGLVCDVSGMATIGHGVCLWTNPNADGGVADGAGQ